MFVPFVCGYRMASNMFCFSFTRRKGKESVKQSEIAKRLAILEFAAVGRCTSGSVMAKY